MECFSVHHSNNVNYEQNNEQGMSIMNKLRMLGVIIVFPLVISSAYGATVNVFFAGGQSNAQPEWANSIESTLTNSGVYSDVRVVYNMHYGNNLALWYNDGPNINYEKDFFAPDGSGLLETALNEINLAGDTYVFSGLFWVQGETDAGDEAWIAGYKSRFLGMMSNIYGDINNGNDGLFNFELAIIDANPAYAELPGRTWNQVNALRQAQSNLVNSTEYGQGYDTRGYERVDEWHLTTSALEEVGKGMANAYLATVVPLPSALWLFGSGLLGLISVPRRKTA
jgi:Carbohydrate esterase, sialic acid-specific acetylesterase